MFKQLGKCSLGVLALVASANAQAATSSVTVNASVLKPITLTGGGTLSFGTIVSPSTATYSGTFKIDAAASQTTTFCATSFSCTGTPAAIMFNMQGTKTNPVSLSIPLTVTLSLQGYSGTGAAPALTMTTANSLFANNSTGTYTYSLPNSGTPGVNFYIGGSITVDQNTAGGSYAGTFNVTADYQ